MSQYEHPGQLADERLGCRGCATTAGVPEIAMALQPIVDAEAGVVYGHEALVRGADGAGAYAVLSQITDANRYAFDQTCRVRSIETAAQLQAPGVVSINFLPNAIYRPEVCIATTIEAAGRSGIPLERLQFEITEVEKVEDPSRLTEIVAAYREIGLRTAIDDFGAGYAGLNLLADFLPDVVKLDMGLIRDLDQRPARRTIVDAVVRICDELGVEVVAEGVEQPDEAAALLDSGVVLHQGYLYARPVLGELPVVQWWPPQRLAAA